MLIPHLGSINMNPILTPNQIYAITLNPNDKRQFYVAPEKNMTSWRTRLATFKNKWGTILNECLSLHEIDYFVYIECSEPLKGKLKPPRLHFHGYIRFNSYHAINEFLLCTLRFLQHESNVYIDTIADPIEWQAYCVKQQANGYGNLNNMPPNKNDVYQWMSLPTRLEYDPDEQIDLSHLT